MSQILDDLRPILAAVRKHQFWLVLGLLPCVLIPTLFAAQAAFDAQIKTHRSQIESRVRELRGVREKSPHPNAQWKAALDAEEKRIVEETRGEWRTFWDSQASLRVWPEELGQPFIQQVTSLRPGGVLNVDARNRYQTEVRRVLVRQLPTRMGAEDRMLQQAVATESPQPLRGNAPFQLVWRPENQQMVYQWFDWKEMPGDGRAATTQIVQAQEELWVYGILCDAIKRANQAAKTRFEAAIVSVNELAVGWPAAEESPGGQGTQRIVAGQSGDLFGGPGPSQPQAFPKSAHPRFSTGAARPGGPPPPSFPGMPPPDGQPAAPDAAFRDCIYVDFNGRPLSAAELAAGPPRMVHLMPFTLRVVMDERRIEPLLADLARQPIPIDVRQLRINPGSVAAVGIGQPAPPVKVGADERKYDVTVELRGTVGLATPPAEPVANPPPAGSPGAAIAPRPSGLAALALVPSITAPRP